MFNLEKFDELISAAGTTGSGLCPPDEWQGFANGRSDFQLVKERESLDLAIYKRGYSDGKRDRNDTDRRESRINIDREALRKELLEQQILSDDSNIQNKLIEAPAEESLMDRVKNKVSNMKL